jgi:hypothetical protein
MTRSCLAFCSPPRHTVGHVNEIRTSGNNFGRPRLELSPARRRALEQLALRIDRLIAELAEARAELTAVALAGRSEGASIRAIAEAIGRSRPRVHELLNDTTEPLQAVEPNGCPTCD